MPQTLLDKEATNADGFPKVPCPVFNAYKISMVFHLLCKQVKYKNVLRLIKCSS